MFGRLFARLPLCDHPDRLAARFYWASRAIKDGEHCPCCTFYRGIAIGFVAGVVVALIAA